MCLANYLKLCTGTDVADERLPLIAVSGTPSPTPLRRTRARVSRAKDRVRRDRQLAYSFNQLHRISIGRGD